MVITTIVMMEETEGICEWGMQLIAKCICVMYRGRGYVCYM